MKETPGDTATVQWQRLRKELASALRALSSAKQKARVLPPGHPYVKEAAGETIAALEFMFDAAPQFTINFTGEDLFLEGQLMPVESVMFEELTKSLREKGIRSLTFSKGISNDDLGNFLALTNLRAEDLDARGTWPSIIAKEGFKHLSVNRFMLYRPELQFTESMSESSRLSREAYQLAITGIMEAFTDVREGLLMNLDLLEDVVRFMVSRIAEDGSIMLGLSNIKTFDDYTFYHSVNVAIISLLMGAHLGLASDILSNMGLAALLHDIGKTKIPLEVITKPGALDQDERKIMESHPVESMKIILRQPEINKLAATVALEHHQRPDGNGYPSLTYYHGLHPYSKIVSLADVYDALTSHRSYRPAMLPDKAMGTMLEMRHTHFDPDLTLIFANMAGIYPVGSLVSLDTYETAVVRQANTSDLFRPRVTIIRDSDGRDCDPFEVDLAERTDGQYVRTILASEDPIEQQVNVLDYF